MFKNILKNVKENKPLVHNITNYVTVNDVANIEIAIGASPLMADELEEMKDIVSISNVLNINIGTLNKRTVASMLLAGKTANQNNIPVVLDPVGASASGYRLSVTKTLLENINFSVIKGNITEIKAIRSLLNDIEGKSVASKGVDALDLDSLNDKNIDDAVKLARNVSKLTGAVIVITSVLDVISSSSVSYTCSNGTVNMHNITGSGCMLSGLVSSFIAANKENALEAALAAVCAIGYAGELAEEIREENKSGNSSFRNYLIDNIFNITEDDLEAGALYELYTK